MALFNDLKEKAAQAAAAAQTMAQNAQEARAEKKEQQAQLDQAVVEKALADAARNAMTIDIVTKEEMQFVHIKMDDTALKTEAGAMYYYRGNITMDASSGPGIGAALLTGESVRRPVYSGTGELILEPTYGQYTIFDVNGESWMINYGRYYASELSVVLGIRKNSLKTALFSGHGLYQTTASGQGKVILESDGPLEKIELVNDKLVVDGNFAIIWSASLDFKVEKATKGLLASALSGEGLVHTFSGTGVVYLCPAAKKLKSLTSKISNGFDSVMEKIKK
ncbi:MAG: AIM24 family protein [Lentisphaeria bacterium]|nr:AIM24 family protein [Lentisphaeria bacterium]